MTELIQVKLLPMEETDRNQFILDNQESFRYGALEEFGVRDEHFEDGKEIISRQTIEECMDRKGAEIYRITLQEKKVGGVVLQINTLSVQRDTRLKYRLLAAVGVNVNRRTSSTPHSVALSATQRRYLGS